EAAPHRLLAEGAVFLIDPEMVGLAVIGHKDVGPTVAVKVGADNTQPRAGGAAESRGLGPLFETQPGALRVPAAVTVEARQRPLEVRRVAIIPASAAEAGAGEGGV